MKSSHKKSGKRKLGLTGTAASATNEERDGEGASSSSNVPEQNFSSMLATSSSSEHAFPGASSMVRSDVVVEMDAVRTPATVNDPHQHHHRHNIKTASGDLNSVKRSASGAQGGTQASTSAETDLSDEASVTLINIVAYVMSMLPENVKECMHNLVRQGVTVTRKTLLDECLKNLSRFPERSDENFPSFPQRVSESQTASFSGHRVSGRGSNTQGAFQVPTSMNSRSENQVSQQHRTNQRNQPKNVVDGGGQANGKYNSSSKMNGPLAASNSISSQSGVKYFCPITDTSKTIPSAGTAGSSSVGSGVSSNRMSTARDSPAVTADTTQGTQNDLNKESSPAAQKDVEPSKDPSKYLQTCLQLVQEEHKRLDIVRHCGECGQKPRDITFLPCGHVWACRSCAEPIYVCPCCNTRIIATVDTYLC
ncbi:hypothetical protein EGW08_022611 [Elysia chlorotica]|uniref:RING-type domain-containing protein n=1 Tax=Elysia chlorotica TaxID=188477 RepID=A0A3S1AVT0_ELYCH|nr:hypothetical protein EGW08_022611 [Elysia chlorotica]